MNEKEIKNYLKEGEQFVKTNVKTWIKWIGVAVLAGLAFYLLIEYAPAYSAFGAALLIVAMCGGLLWFIDEYILRGFDLIEEIKKGNIAASLAILAYAIVIGSAIIGAFVVYR